MKKMFALIASMCMITSAVSVTASAEEYEKYPVITDFSSSDEFEQILADGIADGTYFADFDGNGVFDLVDTVLLSEYYAELSLDSEPDQIDWNGEIITETFSGMYSFGFLENYEMTDLDGTDYIVVNLNNDMLANVMKYGDVDGDGYVTSADTNLLMCAYYKGFSAGDVNADNFVDATDASVVLSYYSIKSTGGIVDFRTEKAMAELADINGDSEIDAGDASAILDRYTELAVAD